MDTEVKRREAGFVEANKAIQAFQSAIVKAFGAKLVPFIEQLNKIMREARRLESKQMDRPKSAPTLRSRQGLYPASLYNRPMNIKESLGIFRIRQRK